MNNNYSLLKKTLPVLGLLLLLGFQTNLNAQLMITDPEGVALMEIYNDTDGANWTYNTNWGSVTEPLDNWYGVTVEGGKVTRLRLVANNLTGTLPDVFDALTDLTFLHFKENNLTGSLPATLGDLVNLTFLGLNDNDFSGTFPAITGLVNLTEMYIQKNGFTGNVPDLSNQTELKYLYVFENEFTGIHAGLLSLTHLRELLVNDNFFTFADLISLKGLASNRFVYHPQGVVPPASVPSKDVGESFSVSYGGSSLTNNSYVWYKDGVAIGGANSFTYNIASLTLADAGVYHVVVTNTDLPLLTLTGAANTLTVNNVPTGPNTFPDWYLTTEADGELAVEIDHPATSSPAIVKAYVWVETFTGSAFEYKMYSPAIKFNSTGPYTWTAENFSPTPVYPLNGSEQTRRVKLKLEDENKLIGDFSDMQESIHLTVNEGNASQINLIWSLYGGKTVDYYEVWGGNTAADVFAQDDLGDANHLATLPNTETSYTDFAGYDYYTVVAVFPSTPFGMKNGEIRKSKSNIYSVSEDGFDNIFMPTMKVYPNPVVETSMIEFDNAGNGEYTLYLLDLSGRILRTEENITGSTYLFNRGNLKTGIYLLQMVGERTIRSKIVIE